MRARGIRRVVPCRMAPGTALTSLSGVRTWSGEALPLVSQDALAQSFSESLCGNDHGGTSRNALDRSVSRPITFGTLC